MNPGWVQMEASVDLFGLFLLMSCTAPHHTNCNPEPQDPCSIKYSNLRYFEESKEFLFYTMSASEDTYLRIKNQLITAQP